MNYLNVLVAFIIITFIILPISAQPNPAYAEPDTPIPGVTYGTVSYGTGSFADFVNSTVNNVVVNTSNNNTIPPTYIDNTTSVVVTPTPTPIPTPMGPLFRPMMGDEVFVGEYVDATGCTGWATSIAYYDGWGNEGDPTYVLKLPLMSKLYKFYIDPTIFNTRPGNWFQYYGHNVDDSKGFIKAFKVVRGFRNTSTTYNNGTINFDNSTGNRTGVDIISPPVATKHVSDFLVARGNNLTIKTNDVARVWIFGTNDGIYNLKTWNNSVFVNTSMINSLRLGDYKVLIQTPGSDREFNVLYNPEKRVLNALYSTQDSWTSKEYDVSDLSPLMLYDKLIIEIDKTNDGYKTLKLVVEDPMLDIISQDEVDLKIARVLRLLGYTNVEAGTKMCFGIDDSIKYMNTNIKNIDKPTCVVAEGSDVGDMRYFVASVPFRYEDLSVGRHFITGITAIGGSMTTGFDVYTTFDDKPRNSSIKYIGGNEFIAKPTPEIIKVVQTQIVREVVTQKVIVQLTPDAQQLYENEKRVKEDENNRMMGYIVISVCGLLILILGGWYAISVIRRLRL